MTNHPNRANRYLVISPRGFSNETVVRFGSKQAVEIAAQIINDDVNAWAEVVPARDPRVTAAKRENAKLRQYYGDRAAADDHGYCRLHEADVVKHRPWLLPSNGPRYQGGPRLPDGYND